MNLEGTHVSGDAQIEQVVADDLDPGRMPRHVAIVMDGNGRWAKQKGRPTLDKTKSY